jgi:hypothetical protein
MHFMEAQCMTANLGAKHSLELITRANSFDDRRREFNAVAAKTIRLNEGVVLTKYRRHPPGRTWRC